MLHRLVGVEISVELAKKQFQHAPTFAALAQMLELNFAKLAGMMASLSLG